MTKANRPQEAPVAGIGDDPMPFERFQDFVFDYEGRTASAAEDEQYKKTLAQSTHG